MVRAEQDLFAVPDDLLRTLPALVVRVNQYVGSFVWMSCISSANEDFDLRVYMADWQFCGPEGLIVDSDGLAEENNTHLKVLEGAELRRIVASDDGRLQLDFTRRRSLAIMPNEEAYGLEDELLITYLKNTLVAFYPAKGFVLEPPVGRKSHRLPHG